ncbi:MAG TPA: DUF2530 domain-containing protein [Nocardioidaceae bacterium]|nr:DUF2530 domain-containing protein [Nocardioidaceae bacterium]
MRLLLRPEERRPDPEPLKTDDRKAIGIGTVVWAVLAVVALVFRSELERAGHDWWVWCAVAGFVLGLLGLGYLHRRELRRR